MEFFPEIVVTEGEAGLIAHGLMAVARADGKVHERELSLVSSFYGEIAGGSSMSLASLMNEADIDPAVLAAGLTREAVAMLFVKTCILLAYADGEYRPAEKARIDAFAHALEIPDSAVEELRQSVKEYLVGHLAGLANRDAVLAVAKKLDV